MSGPPPYPSETDLDAEAHLAGRLPYSSETDLDANREAGINRRQRLDLMYSGLWRLVFGPPTAAVGVVWIWTVSVPSNPLGNVFGTALGLVFLGFGTYISWRGFGFLVDAITRKVTYITGRVDWEIKTSSKGTLDYMVVGPVKTWVAPKAFEALPVGLLCHAYYSPCSLHLLSIEPATAADPPPSLRFDGAEAHEWARFRWGWFFAALAAFGLAAAIHDLVVAHPAQTVMVSGRIGAYSVDRSRLLLLQGSSQEYVLDSLSSASPPDRELYLGSGEPVDLHVNTDQPGDVLALRFRNRLYAGDLYVHPEHQYWGMVMSGAPIALLSVITFALLWWRPYWVRKHPKEDSDVTSDLDEENDSEASGETDEESDSAVTGEVGSARS